MAYLDRTFCSISDAKNKKCRACYAYLDREKYDANCKRLKYKIPISFYLEPPCGLKKIPQAQTKTD